MPNRGCQASFPHTERQIQKAFQTTRFNQLKNKIAEIESSIYSDKKHVILVDRSIYGNFCFALSQYFKGSLTYDNFEKLNQQLLEYEATNIFPDLFIYLNVDPKLCFERNIKRGREFERNISLEYLSEIKRSHDIAFKLANSKNRNVLVLTSDEDENNFDVFKSKFYIDIYKVISEKLNTKNEN